MPGKQAATAKPPVAVVEEKIEAVSQQQQQQQMKMNKENEKAGKDIKIERPPRAKGSKPLSQPTSRNNSESEQKARCRNSSHKKSQSFCKDNHPGGAGEERKVKHSSHSVRTISQTSNGEGSDFSMGDMEEPFSSDEEEHELEKPNLPMPQLRARTLSGTWPETGYSPKWGGPSMCVSCLQFFNLPEQMEEFKEHLLKEHKIIISELELIVDPKRYVEHWRQRFNKESIDRIFPRVDVNEDHYLYGLVDFYYHIVPTVEEDASIRRDLALRRLEEALSCQQRERDDREFKLGCIFCRYVARGNRSKMIHHLYMIHHLNLGKPDNLVFVREYIETLKNIMDRNECICCEKVFPDKATLMDHMRKRNHKEVNPKNHYYDKFYIINYLEVGKRWTEVLDEDGREDDTVAFECSDEEPEERQWDEWEKDNIVDDTRAVCVMCSAYKDSLDELDQHMTESHNLHLLRDIKEMKLNTYQRMKLINYIRKQNFNGSCWICQQQVGNPLQLAEHMTEKGDAVKKIPLPEIWDQEDNSASMFGNDNLLWLLESHFAEREESEEAKTPKKDKLAGLVEESKKNHVDEVVAEDFPDVYKLEIAELDSLM